MVRKLAIFALLLSIVAITPVLSQEYRGNLYVSVMTDSGEPIVGATVTVSGIGASRTTETNDGGNARFIKVEPGAYTVEISKDGFNTLISQGVRVNTGANVDFDVSLQRSKIVEEVTVTAVTPLLDKRKTGTSTFLSPDEINKIPSARDPWAVLSTIPGIQTDRINVGGNQSGQQASFVGKGDDGSNATWVMDGVEFTDLAAQGGSSTYFDFNSFNEIGFTTGGGDFEQSAPGQQLSFNTKQGTNAHSGSIGMVYGDGSFQDSATPYIDPDGGAVVGNQIQEVFEKNFELGGPIVQDTAWYWFGFSQNNVDVLLPGPGGTTVTDRTKLQNLTGKVNANFNGKTSVKGFYTRGDKIKIGRNAGPDRPAETSWDQGGPTPIYTFDASHFFTEDLELSGQISHVGGGFGLTPQGTAEQIRWDSGFVWRDTFIDYKTDRPQDQYALRANWFAQTGSIDHEFKFGFKFKEGDVQSFSTYGTDNIVAVDWLGEAWLYRGGTAKVNQEYTSIWAGDTMVLNNWTINVGAQYIDQSGTQAASTSAANGLFPLILPDLVFDGRAEQFSWQDVLPRLGVTYSFDTDRRQLIRFNYGSYVDQLGTSDVSFNHPMNTAEIDYYWYDLNSDQLVQFAELGAPTGFAGNVDPLNPTSTTSLDTINPNLEAPQVEEFILGYEIELAKDFTLGINYTNRVRDRELWAPLSDLGTTDEFDWLDAPYIADGTFSGDVECADNFDLLGNPLGPCLLSTNGNPYTFETYILDPLADSDGNTRVLSNRPGYEEEFEGWEVTATKRLSNNWMMRGYFAVQDWTKNITCTAMDVNGSCIAGPGIQNPANTVGDTNIDGSDVYVGGGTSSGGFANAYLGSASWTYNLNGLYQLPKNFSVSANLNGREGYALPLFRTVGGGVDRFGYQVNTADSERLEDLHILDFRLGYLLQLEGGTAVDLGFEVFNVTDDDTILQLQRRVDNNAGTIFESLSPRIFRLGARITFK